MFSLLETGGSWSQMKMLASKSRTGWATKSATVVSGLQELEAYAGRFAKTQPLHLVRRTVCFLGGKRKYRSLIGQFSTMEKTDEHRYER